MEALLDLWLPIVVSAAVVWIASALAWMVMPHHKGEFRKIPNESAFMEMVKSSSIAQGQYMFPYCDDPSKMKSDADLKARMEAGPWGTLNVFAGWGNMGAKMGASFVFYLVVSVTVAYLATMSGLGAANAIVGVTADPAFMDVFRFVGTAAIAAYAFGRIPHDIWFNTPRKAMIANLADGVVYGILTGIIFGLLW